MEITFQEKDQTLCLSFKFCRRRLVINLTIRDRLKDFETFNALNYQLQDCFEPKIYVRLIGQEVVKS